MTNRLICVVSCGVCLALLGCAGERQRFAGFLRDQSTLEPHPAGDAGLISWNRCTDPEHLKGALVESVQVRVVDLKEEHLAQRGDVAAFRMPVTNELLAAIGRYTEMATEPGTNENPKQRDTNVASN